MTGIEMSVQRSNDALVRDPATWFWLVVAVLGLACCWRVLFVMGSYADDWLSLAILLVMAWIANGCLLDLAFSGLVLGHLQNLLQWQFGALGAIWVTGGYWLANHLSNWIFARPGPKQPTTPDTAARRYT